MSEELLEFDLSNNFYAQEKDYHYITKSFDIINIIYNTEQQDHKNCQTRVWHKCYVVLTKIFEELKKPENLDIKYFKIIKSNNNIKIYKSLEILTEDNIIYDRTN